MFYKKVEKFLSYKECHYYHEYLLSLKQNGQFDFDDQCPFSHAFYRALDSLLIEKLPDVEKQFNIQLLPTYTYSRLYRKGEILAPHVDREACEYSVSITLATSDQNNPWTIFMEGEEISLKVSDACLYKGCETNHWRNACPIDWQAQCFLHYVDKNGQFKDIKDVILQA